MALPGLHSGGAPPTEEAATSTTHDLTAQSEWRFEVASTPIQVKLLSGTAEIFGTELAVNQPYTFPPGRKAAVYTWHGCRLEVHGACLSDYVAEETPMATYANLHFALENLRDAATATGTTGPRVMIVGPSDAGKTSLVKLLAAYAMKMGRTPVVTNLDPKEGMLTIPGTISAVTLESILDVEDGWGSSPTTGPSQIPVKLPLVYFYGNEDLEAQRERSKPLIARLALSVANRLEEDPLAKHSGLIVDTPGAMSHGKNGFEMIQHAVAEFSINVLVVLGSERLNSEMTRRFAPRPPTAANGAAPPVSVLKLDKSGGCVERDSQYMEQLRHAQLRTYFFGDIRSGLALSPHTQVVDFDEIALWKHIENPILFTDLLPGGPGEDEDEDSSAHPNPDASSGGGAANATSASASASAASKAAAPDLFEPVPPPPPPQVHGAILAVLQVEPAVAGSARGQAALRDASVVGFLYVADVEEKKRKLRILAPLGGRLPRKAVLWGQWPEGGADLVG